MLGCGFGHQAGTWEAQEFCPAATGQSQALSLALALEAVLWEVQRAVEVDQEVGTLYLRSDVEVRNSVVARTDLEVAGLADSMDALFEPVEQSIVPSVPVHNGCWVVEQRVERCRARGPVLSVPVVE